MGCLLILYSAGCVVSDGRSLTTSPGSRSLQNLEVAINQSSSGLEVSMGHLCSVTSAASIVTALKARRRKHTSPSMRTSRLSALKERQWRCCTLNSQADIAACAGNGERGLIQALLREVLPVQHPSALQQCLGHIWEIKTAAVSTQTHHYRCSKVLLIFPGLSSTTS